jgi:hypothetical protein
MGGFGVEGGGSIIAVVVTVAVDVAGLPPAGVTEVGASVHVESVSEDGSAHVSATAELNPKVGVTVTV